MPWLNDTLTFSSFIDGERGMSEALWNSYTHPNAQLRCRRCHESIGSHYRPNGQCHDEQLNPGQVMVSAEPSRQAINAATPRQRQARTTPGELVTSRRFGVEIELTHLNTAPFQADMQRYSIPYQSTNRSGSTQGTPSAWQLKHDGSVHGMGLELISPPLSGVKGLAEVKLVVELAKANGGRIDDSCGLHVHHSAHDLADSHLKNLLVLWYKYQDLAYGVANASRQNNRFCYKLSDAEFNQLYGMSRGFGAAVRGLERYRGLNFASLNAHNTIEFRLLEGTLNSRKIEAWIALTQRIIRVARYSGNIDPSKVGSQFQLLGAVTKMLSRNGYQASEEETEAFNLLSSYYHKNMRANRPARRRARREGMGE